LSVSTTGEGREEEDVTAVGVVFGVVGDELADMMMVEEDVTRMRLPSSL
jgi:hypothetical protein